MGILRLAAVVARSRAHAARRASHRRRGAYGTDCGPMVGLRTRRDYRNHDCDASSGSNAGACGSDRDSRTGYRGGDTAGRGASSSRDGSAAHARTGARTCASGSLEPRRQA